MALNLARKSIVRLDTDRFSTNPAPDLYTAGLSKLGENVLKYNQQYLADGVLLDDLEAEAEVEFAAPNGAP